MSLGLGNLFGSILQLPGQMMSGLGEAITPNVAEAVPDINLESTQLEGFTPMSNQTGMPSFAPKLQLDTKGAVVPNTTGGLGGSAGNLAKSTNLNAPGTGGTSQGMDWMSTVGTLGKLYEAYKNDKRADAAINVQIKDRQNSRERAKAVQDQMTGGTRDLSGSDYKYV